MYLDGKPLTTFLVYLGSVRSDPTFGTAEFEDVILDDAKGVVFKNEFGAHDLIDGTNKIRFLIDPRDLVSIDERDSNQTIGIGKHVTVNWVSSREENGNVTVIMISRSDSNLHAKDLPVDEVMAKINSIVGLTTPNVKIYVAPYAIYFRRAEADTVTIPDPSDLSKPLPIVSASYSSSMSSEEIKSLIKADFAHEYGHVLQRTYMKTQLWGGYTACFDEGSAEALAEYAGFRQEQLSAYNQEGMKCSELAIGEGYPRAYCMFYAMKQAGLFSDAFFHNLFRSKVKITNDCELTDPDTQRSWLDMVSEAAGHDVSVVFKEKIWD